MYAITMKNMIGSTTAMISPNSGMPPCANRARGSVSKKVQAAVTVTMVHAAESRIAIR